MAQAFLITLREGIEAALIVSIVLAYLARTGNRAQLGKVWLGVAAAVVGSLLVGALMFMLVGEFSGQGQQIFEGVAMLTAVVVLSYMILWMKKQAVNIRANLQAQVDAALKGGSALALAILAFVAVGREGIETVLFMFAAVKTSTPLESTTGGLLGLATAVALGYGIYRGSRLLNLRWFFNVTGVLLILFAGGLLASGIHELQEASVFPTVIEHVWDINPILDENTGLGSFLKAIFGYNGNPSLVEVVAYGAYLLGAFRYFSRSFKPVTQEAAPPEP